MASEPYFSRSRVLAGRKSCMTTPSGRSSALQVNLVSVCTRFRSLQSLTSFKAAARMPDRSTPRANRDAYYTPTSLAQAAVDAATIEPTIVMDAAVGDGALLRAASAKWPTARIVGLDVDHRQLRLTGERHPNWSLGRMDMFSPQSRAASTLWRSTAGEVDLMLLNPPFSYRGGRSISVRFDGEEYALTPASAFVALSLTRLTPNGELLALMPAGVLALERDDGFWSAVSSRWSVETRGRFASTAFRGTRTKSILVSVSPRRSATTAEVVEFSPRPSKCVELVRGRIPVHRLKQTGTGQQSAPFLHTKDLARLGDPVDTGLHAATSLATRGPFLTLPRVGRVRPEHIQLVTAPERVVLSDCVFALRTSSASELDALQALLLESVGALQLEYAGGCAPYLTIRRLIHFLARRGYCGHHVPASSLPSAGMAPVTCMENAVIRATS